jgi:hypothetical protein
MLHARYLPQKHRFYGLNISEKSPTISVVAGGLWVFNSINYTLGKSVPVTGREGL